MLTVSLNWLHPVRWSVTGRCELLHTIKSELLVPHGYSSETYYLSSSDGVSIEAIISYNLI